MEVREIIQRMGDDAGGHIAEEISAFRNDAAELLERVDDADRSAVQKRVNNVINDVARICREEIGQTVKMVSRKDGYVYRAIEWDPPPKEEAEADTSSAAYLRRALAEALTQRDWQMQINEEWERRFNDLEEIMEHAVTKFGKEKVGHEFVRQVKELDK
jgi:hypothetical protein